MRTTQRDKRTVSYALYRGVTDVVDSEGNLTGEKTVTYENPVTTRMNISGGKGKAGVELFGIDTPFTKVAVTDDLSTPFDMDTVWWFEADPAHDPYNYRCTGICRTINQVAIALAEVDKS